MLELKKNKFPGLDGNKIRGYEEYFDRNIVILHEK